MHRQGGEDAVPDLNGVGKTGSVDEIPGTQPGTRHAAELVNAFQEEICGVIEAAGLTIQSNAGNDRGASWGQLLTAIRDSALLITASIANGAITNAKLATGSVSTNKILDDAVTKVKLADNAKIFVTSTEYTTINTSGGGGGGAVITEFNRSLVVGEWYRVSINIQSVSGFSNIFLFNGQAIGGPNAGVPEIAGGALTIDTGRTGYVSVLFKSIDGFFSAAAGTSTTYNGSTLILESAVVRDDSPG